MNRQVAKIIKSRKVLVGGYMCDNKDYFPDGTIIEGWFSDEETISLNDFENKFNIIDYGVEPNGKICTNQIQAIIDKAAQIGRAVVVIPKGEFLCGALFFKRGVSLCVMEGAVLKGSDDICDYPVMKTRIEGESCLYFPALINADHNDEFKLFGGGTIDGNGERSWRAFWQRRAWNPECTNKDEQRPRLIFISNSNNVTVQNLNLQNSHFWTTHLYMCKYARITNCNITAPREPIKSPSTDAIDIDVCTDVLIKGCTFNVNDDGIALKGGKGPYADELCENGANERIIIEDCHFIYCQGCLTCGSEAIHNKNVLLRRSRLSGPWMLLWLKMRPDTPQCYEYIKIEDISGDVDIGLCVLCWTQFFDLKGRSDIPMSYANHIEFINCNLICKNFFDVSRNDEFYQLSDFTFENITVETKENKFRDGIIDNLTMINTDISVD